MSSPYTSQFQAFAAGTDATATVALPQDGDWAGSVDLSFTGSGFTGTFDFEGRPHPSATWQAIPYAILDGSAGVSIAQVSLTTSSATIVYTLIRPMPYMRVVMTRSAGSFGMMGRYFGGPAVLPFEVTPITSGTSNAYGTLATVTRAANQTPYTANDVVGGAIALGVVGPSAGRVLIQSVQLQPRITAVPTGMANMRLALYSVTPPSAIADNGAWTLASGDLASFLGIIDLGTPALPAASSAALIVSRMNVGLEVLLAGTSLFAYLITDAGFTPAANSEIYALTLSTVAL